MEPTSVISWRAVCRYDLCRHGSGTGLRNSPWGAITTANSDADAEVAFFLNPRLRVFALTASQSTWGGIPLTRDFPNDLTTQEFLHHDQIARADLVDVGFGAQLKSTGEQTSSAPTQRQSLGVTVTRSGAV